MNSRNNLILNILMGAILLVMVVVGIAVTKSVDLLRMRFEKLSEQVSEVQGRIAVIEKAVSSISSGAVARPSGPAQPEGAPAVANSQYYDPEAQPGGRLILATAADTKNMNYIINNESFIADIWEYCNDTLGERDLERPEAFAPKLAESWKLSDDKMTYRMKLRKGILWHDFTDPVSGRKWEDVEVTAKDFKFYLEVVKNEDVDCAPLRSYLIDLDRIDVVSDHEFDVVWKRPYFLSEPFTLGLSPLPRHLYHAYDGPFDGKKFNDDHERNRIIVGCGPYRFVRWDKDQRIILKKWDRYYGGRLGVMPPIDNLIFEIIKNPNTRFQALLSKKIDRLGLIPEQWQTRTSVPEFDTDKGILLKYKYPGRAYYYIGYNLAFPLFQDRRVRLALTHLVDRERILKEVYFGLGRITSGPFFMDTPYYDKSIQPWPFSIEKAKELLAEAGWSDKDGDGIIDKDGKKFEFTVLSVSDNPIQQRMLPIIKEDMAKAGVVMNISTVEWSVYTQRLEKKSFEVCTLGWRMGFEDDPYQLWHSSEADKPASSNHISFRNKQADELIEQIRVCFDMKKRIELCHQFHKLLHDEQPYTFLVSPDSLIAQHRRYKNVRVFPAGIDTKIMWDPVEGRLPIPGE